MTVGAVLSYAREEAILLSILMVLGLVFASGPIKGSVGHQMIAVAARPMLRDVLMDKFHAMNAADNGLFQEDVSAAVAPYFPPGQTFQEAENVVQQQNLGQLQVFKGKHDAADGSMYVTKFALMSAAFSEVYIVLNLYFDGNTKEDMTLKKTSASIRTSNM